MLMRKPLICRIRPGRADISWSMLIQSPGSVLLSFLMDPGTALDLQGLRWDIPKTHDMQTGTRSRRCTNFLLIRPACAMRMSVGNGTWFILQCNAMSSLCLLSRISGWGLSCDSLGSSEAYCLIMTGTCAMLVSSGDEMRTPSTRYSLPSKCQILCLVLSLCCIGPM